MILQVHDELVFTAPSSEKEQAIALIKNSMEHALKTKVPLKVDVGSGDNWFEAH
jgi:DNA polymerase-1